MNQTIGTLAGLGEFVGGVAVLVTLVYLAVQVHQARHQLTRQTTRDAIARSTHLLAMELQDQTMIRRHISAFNDYDSLPLEDKYAFSNWMLCWIGDWEQRSIDMKYGDIRSADPIGIAYRLRTPGGKQWWEQIGKRSFSQKTVQILEKATASDDTNFFDFHS